MKKKTPVKKKTVYQVDYIHQCPYGSVRTYKTRFFKTLKKAKYEEKFFYSEYYLHQFSDRAAHSGIGYNYARYKGKRIKPWYAKNIIDHN